MTKIMWKNAIKAGFFTHSLLQAERIEIGEEVGQEYVKSVLMTAIDQWNHAAESLRQKMSDPETLLKELDATGCESEHDLKKTLENLHQRTNSRIKRIAIDPKHSAFLILGHPAWE